MERGHYDSDGSLSDLGSYSSDSDDDAPAASAAQMGSPAAANRWKKAGTVTAKKAPKKSSGSKLLVNKWRVAAAAAAAGDAGSARATSPHLVVSVPVPELQESQVAAAVAAATAKALTATAKALAAAETQHQSELADAAAQNAAALKSAIAASAAESELNLAAALAAAKERQEAEREQQVDAWRAQRTKALNATRLSLERAHSTRMAALTTEVMDVRNELEQLRRAGTPALVTQVASLQRAQQDASAQLVSARRGLEAERRRHAATAGQLHVLLGDRDRAASEREALAATYKGTAADVLALEKRCREAQEEIAARAAREADGAQQRAVSEVHSAVLQSELGRVLQSHEESESAFEENLQLQTVLLQRSGELDRVRNLLLSRTQQVNALNLSLDESAGAFAVLCTDSRSTFEFQLLQTICTEALAKRSERQRLSKCLSGWSVFAARQAASRAKLRSSQLVAELAREDMQVASEKAAAAVALEDSAQALLRQNRLLSALVEQVEALQNAKDREEEELEQQNAAALVKLALIDVEMDAAIAKSAGIELSI